MQSRDQVAFSYRLSGGCPSDDLTTGKVLPKPSNASRLTLSNSETSWHALGACGNCSVKVRAKFCQSSKCSIECAGPLRNHSCWCLTYG